MNDTQPSRPIYGQRIEMPQEGPPGDSAVSPPTAHGPDPYEQGRQAGIRQAVAWLQADYEYGDMPEWRQSGVDWIEARARDERIAANAGPVE